MPLKFHPKPGTLLICDFNTGFKPPEMIKKRPVVIISPRPRRNIQLCTVIPLSTTEPSPVEAYHHLLRTESLPEKLSSKLTWAKCNVIATVALDRLDRIHIGQNNSGKRQYISPMIMPDDFQAIQHSVLIALGLHNNLTIIK